MCWQPGEVSPPSHLQQPPRGALGSSLHPGVPPLGASRREPREDSSFWFLVLPFSSSRIKPRGPSPSAARDVQTPPTPHTRGRGWVRSDLEVGQRQEALGHRGSFYFILPDPNLKATLPKEASCYGNWELVAVCKSFKQGELGGLVEAGLGKKALWPAGAPSEGVC